MTRPNCWRAATTLFLGSLASCGTLRVDTRTLFAQLTYATGPTDVPQTNHDLELLANLELEGITAYRNPKAMASCLRMLQPSMMRVFGQKLSKAGTAWANIASGIPVEGACGAADDRALVQYVIARLAMATWSMAQAGPSEPANQKAWVYDRVPAALNAIAKTLEQTPDRTNDIEDAPALALSGGSSNGAFSSGFMFELLSLRERSLPPEGDGGKYTFSAIIGTSVGSLIAQILDLYFVDARTALSPAVTQALTICNSYWDHKPTPSCASTVDAAIGTGGACFDGWPSGDLDLGLSGLDSATRKGLAASRPRQMCALTKLYESFTDNDEQTLMCVEPGPVSSAVGILGRKTQNLMRFDPMYQNIVGPVLDAYAAEMVNNPTTRVVVSVESESNQVLGLDERACAAMPPGEGAGEREYCLGAGVMASAVLPFFARPVAHAYGGTDTQNGVCGTWFDGGLRSGFPVYRAMRMTRPALAPYVADPSVRLRVLAVSTGRSESEASSRPQDIVSIAFNAISQMSNSNEVDEVMLAQQIALLREDQLFEIGNPNERRPRAPDLSTKSDLGGDAIVSTVFVPADAPPQIVAGGQYSFDRYIMRGLWTWGRYVALQRVLSTGALAGQPGLFSQLGWGELETKAQAFAARDLSTISPWLQAYQKPECAQHESARMDAGRKRINTCVKDCADVVAGGSGFPQHLICPAGLRQ